MKNKGFTLVELIAMIIILSVIMLLSFSSLTNALKRTKLKEIDNFKDKLITSTTLYVETHLSNYPTLETNGGTAEINVSELIDKGYVDSEIENPTTCAIANTYIEVKKQEDMTLSYEVKCRT